jgi:hypothetical protein
MREDFLRTPETVVPGAPEVTLDDRTVVEYSMT